MNKIELIYKNNEICIYSFETKTERKEYYLIDNVAGLIATFSINENNIYSFQSGKAYCFNNHNYYMEEIKKANLIIE